MTPTPTVLVSGSLGSGKTTLVKAIVAANPGCRFGVIVNEFGEVGIDGDLLRPYVPRVVEIRNGCICCATQDQLVPAVRDVLARYAVDVLLVEMSGAGDPLPVSRNLRVLHPMVALRRQVVLVDVTAEPNLAMRERSFRNALAFADLAVMTKTDIGSANVVDAWNGFLANFRARLRTAQTTSGGIPLPLLLDRLPAPDGADATPPADRHHQPGEHRLTSVCQWGDATTSEGLRKFVARHGKKIERIKGILWVDGELSEVQCVRERLTLGPYQGAAPARGRLVFISSLLNARELREVVHEYFATDEEMAGIS